MSNFEAWTALVAAEQERLSGRKGTINGAGEYRQLYRECVPVVEAAVFLNMANKGEDR